MIGISNKFILDGSDLNVFGTWELWNNDHTCAKGGKIKQASPDQN